MGDQRHRGRSAAHRRRRPRPDLRYDRARREGRAVLARGPTRARAVSVVAAARPGPFHQRRPSVRAFRSRLSRGNTFLPHLRRRGHAPSHAERDRDGCGNRSASNARLIRQRRRHQSALSSLGFRVCLVDTPCLTSGRCNLTPREVPVFILRVILLLFRALFRDRSQLALENLALRQQLAILRHKAPRPRLRRADRAFWVSLAWVWDQWRSALILVKPETVLRWHRQGFRYFWRCKSRGRPCVSPEVIRLIRRMSRENPLWGAPRIRSELLLLGYDVAESTVAKYMTRRGRPPSQTWRTFLRNHLRTTAACDFFVVPTATFRLLFCLVILSYDRRRILHCNVTAHPTVEWTAQQIVEAFPAEETEPRYLLRDRDSIYGDSFRHRVAGLGIKEIVTAPQSPWQNPYAERVIGSIRRECLDHLIILGERHLRNILQDYVNYYNVSRPHLSLGRNAPIPRSVEPSALGAVVAVPQVGGLHHRYTRAA